MRLLVDLKRRRMEFASADDNYDHYGDMVEKVVCMTDVARLPDVFKWGNDDYANSLVAWRIYLHQKQEDWCPP